MFPLGFAGCLPRPMPRVQHGRSLRVPLHGQHERLTTAGVQAYREQWRIDRSGVAAASDAHELVLAVAAALEEAERHARPRRHVVWRVEAVRRALFGLAELAALQAVAAPELLTRMRPATAQVSANSKAADVTLIGSFPFTIDMLVHS